MAKIGVDIGHGNNTFPPSKGVYKNGIGYHEHDANSRVAVQLTAKLKKAGHTVVQAQGVSKADVNLTIRTNKYKAENVDLIVSCHANAGDASAHGYASFYWHSDSKAKKLSDLYADEIKKQGFYLWGGSRPSKPNDWSNFHMCRVPANAGIPSILIENGFMTNSSDFEWIFGSKSDEYSERCATAAYNAIQRYLGGKTTEAEPTKVASTTVASSTSDDLLKKGDKGAAVTVLQKDLIAKGFSLPEYGADGDYGDETVAAVKALQRAAGITVDGIYGPATAKALDNYGSKTSGSGTQDIKEAQKWANQYANECGFTPLAVDGYNGPKTMDALLRICQHFGKTPIDGIWGPKTKASVPVQSQENHRPGWTRLIQATLNCLGYNLGIDGIYGANTRDAVAAFQRSKGITADGIAGPDTFEQFFKDA
jgi:peptidoglycan hydrolase-like protein with peptidoglycan-binding domain/N-acetylmuramoyl-L-alanine amidase